jgi:hypothetical protein
MARGLISVRPPLTDEEIAEALAKQAATTATTTANPSDPGPNGEGGEAIPNAPPIDDPTIRSTSSGNYYYPAPQYGGYPTDIMHYGIRYHYREWSHGHCRYISHEPAQIPLAAVDVKAIIHDYCAEVTVYILFDASAHSSSLTSIMFFVMH